MNFEKFENFARDKKNSGPIWRLARWSHYRFLVPFRRNPAQPHILALGAGIGLAIGFTPTMGLQLGLILGLWWLSNRLFDRDFSVALAVACSFVSNPATMAPLYYLYYRIGNLMLGRTPQMTQQRFEDLSGQAGAAQDSTWWDSSLNVMEFFWTQVGPAMFLGCLPLMVLGGVGGYFLIEHVGRGYMLYRRKIMDVRAQRKQMREEKAAKTGL